jgi:hypothetical protein
MEKRLMTRKEESGVETRDPASITRSLFGLSALLFEGGS